MPRGSWLPSLWGESRDVQEPFQAMRRQLDELFDDWTQDLRGASPLKPRIEVTEGDHDVLITAELPGVEQKDVEVNLSGRHLSIKGEKRTETEEEKEGVKGRVYHRSERSYGAFQRTIPLHFDADPSSVSATFHDGVLKITVPKPAELHAQATRIEVNKAS